MLARMVWGTFLEKDLTTLQNGRIEPEKKCPRVPKLKCIEQGLAMPVVMAFGLVGNILSIMVLRSPAIDMKVTNHQRYLSSFSQSLLSF